LYSVRIKLFQDKKKKNAVDSFQKKH